MKRALILAALLPLCAQAQSDKAMHVLGSAGLGLSIRHVTDSRAAAFWSTLAIGAAKEIADSQQAGNRFDGKDMLANLAGAALSTLGPAPSYIGAMGYSAHTSSNGGRLTNDTPGLLLGWDAAWLPWERGSVDAALFRNSQGHPGFYAGASKEWNPLPRLYLGAGGGAVYGYRKDQVQTTFGAPLAGHYIGYADVQGGRVYAYEVPQKARWLPAALLKARVQLDHGFSPQITWMPAGSLAKLFKRTGYGKESDAWSFQLVYRRAF